jgi:hypothetical protein
MERPVSVTIICWLLIGLSVYQIATLGTTLNEQHTIDLMQKITAPAWLQYTMLYLGIGVTIGCGIAMLAGQPLGRLVYVGWNIAAAFYGLATLPHKTMVVPGLVLFGILAFFLFRPDANRFFSDED